MTHENVLVERLDLIGHLIEKGRNLEIEPKSDYVEICDVAKGVVYFLHADKSVRLGKYCYWKGEVPKKNFSEARRLLRKIGHLVPKDYDTIAVNVSANVSGGDGDGGCWPFHKFYSL